MTPQPDFIHEFVPGGSERTVFFCVPFCQAERPPYKWHGGNESDLLLFKYERRIGKIRAPGKP